MATRFYLPASGAGAVTPTVAAEWEHNNAANRRMHPIQTNTAFATTSYSPDAADDLTDRDSMVVQFVSDPLLAQTISAQTLKIQILGNETNAADNLFLTWKVYLCSRTGTTGSTLLAIRRDGTELVVTTNTNRSDSATSSSQTCSLGDRIVLEVGYGGLCTASGGVQGHNGGLRFGDTGTTDLAENDTDTGDAKPWLEFANDLNFELPVSYSGNILTEQPFPVGFLRRGYREYGTPGFVQNAIRGVSARAQVSWVQVEVPEAAAAAGGPQVGQLTDLPPRAPLRMRDYSFSDPSEYWLFGTDAMLVGDQQTELPPRAPLRARDYSYYDSFPLVLIGQDALPVGDQRFELPTPAAPRMRDYSFVESFPLVLISQDAMATGDQSYELPPKTAPRLRDYTWAHDSDIQLIGQDAMATGDQSFDLAPQPAPLRLRDYTWTEAFPLSLIGQDALPVGDQRTELPPYAAQRARDYSFVPPINLSVLTTVVQFIPDGKQSTDSLPPRGAPRARDYTWTQELIPVLVGQDAMVTGQQHTALPPIGSLRARDYSFTPPINLSVLTTVVQFIPDGKQSTDSLPPRGALRARDYTWTQELIPVLVGQDTTNAGKQSFDLAPQPAPLRARDYSITESFPLTLIGQDAMLVGDQHTALPPIGPLRARDYSFTPPINLSTLTTVVQFIPDGKQLTDALPPRAAPRARDYTWVQELLPTLLNQDQTNAGKQSFDLAPQPAPLRARDYTFTASFPLTLIGQDAMLVGEQRYELAPIAPLRMRDYSFVPPANLSVLTTVIQPIPPGQQLLDVNTPRIAARARDYSHSADLIPNLIGQDAMVTGEQFTELPSVYLRTPRMRDYSYTLPQAAPLFPDVPQITDFTDLPPRGALRARDYTFTRNAQTQLIGQDAMTVGDSTHATELPPRAPARARDYTWLQSMQLYIFQQLPTGKSTAGTEGPPRGPLRMRDYTHLDVTKLNLIGQDRIYAGPGQVPSYDWQIALPPRAYPRMRDYTVIARLDIATVVAATRVGKHTLSDSALYTHALTDAALGTHTLTDSALFIHTLDDSVDVD